MINEKEIFEIKRSLLNWCKTIVEARHPHSVGTAVSGLVLEMDYAMVLMQQLTAAVAEGDIQDLDEQLYEEWKSSFAHFCDNYLDRFDPLGDIRVRFEKLVIQCELVLKLPHTQKSPDELAVKMPPIFKDRLRMNPNAARLFIDILGELLTRFDRAGERSNQWRLPHLFLALGDKRLDFIDPKAPKSVFASALEELFPDSRLKKRNIQHTFSNNSRHFPTSQDKSIVSDIVQALMPVAEAIKLLEY